MTCNSTTVDKTVMYCEYKALCLLCDLNFIHYDDNVRQSETLFEWKLLHSLLNGFISCFVRRSYSDFMIISLSEKWLIPDFYATAFL